MRMMSAPLSARYLVVTGPTPYQVKSKTWIPSNAYRFMKSSLPATHLDCVSVSDVIGDSDGADGTEPHQALRRQSQQTTVHFAIVLADLRRRSRRSDWCRA